MSPLKNGKNSGLEVRIMAGRRQPEWPLSQENGNIGKRDREEDIKAVFSIKRCGRPEKCSELEF